METLKIIRAYIQEFDGKLGPESSLVSDELIKRGVEVKRFYAEKLLLFGGLDLKRTDLLVGDFDCTKNAMKALGIKIPFPFDYPECLKHLLNRKIWKSTLGKISKEIDLETKTIFIKPSSEIKLFCGLLLNLDWLSYLLSIHDKNTEIYCSEIVDFKSEYRIYVVNGAIRAICHYEKEKLDLDMEVVNNAIDLLNSIGDNGVKMKSYAIDFGIIQKDNKNITTLIEVNDAISLGAYEGINSSDYTDLIVSRWEELLNQN